MLDLTALAALVLGLWGLLHLSLLWGLRAPRLPPGNFPADFGLPAQEVWLEGAQGQRLFAWLVLAPSSSEPAAAVVVLHGWGANASLMLPVAQPLWVAGMTVLLIDARCHGRSSGAWHTSLPRFAQDLDVAVSWLQARPEVDAERIAVIGHSVGGAAAIWVASRRSDLRAVISAGAFAHPGAMMQRYLNSLHIPFQPFGRYILWHVQKVIGARFEDIAPQNRIRELRCPLLLVHGLQDSTVPFADAQALRAAARADQRVNLLTVDSDHDMTDALQHHVSEVLAFLAESFDAAKPPTNPHACGAADDPA
jgi:dipeptidyl aminopeptidase/acylaminoacyl peptidase